MKEIKKEMEELYSRGTKAVKDEGRKE